MKILITGGTGFIGSHLVKALKEEHELFLLTRRLVSSNIVPDSHIIVFKDNIRELHKFIELNEIESIIHLATLYIAEHQPEDIKDLILSNIYLGTALLEASVHTKVNWFLNIGTIWQNYNSAPLSDEYNPVNLYAATKQAFMTVAKYYEETTGIRFITLKLCDTYGSGDKRRKIMDLFKECAETGNPLKMSEGLQLIDIIHVDYVIEGINILINKLSTNSKDLKDEYVVSSGRHITLRQLASDYENKFKVKLNLEWGTRPYRKREVMVPYQGQNILKENNNLIYNKLGGGIK